MQCVHHPLLDRMLEAGRDEVDDDLGVAGRLEKTAAADERLAQLVGIGEVAVVADGEAAEFEIGEERLDIAHRDFAGRRIAHMADRRMPLEAAPITSLELKFALTWPMPRWRGTARRHRRRCRPPPGRDAARHAGRARWSAAASAWPKMPNTPHSSCGWSSSRDDGAKGQGAEHRPRLGHGGVGAHAKVGSGQRKHQRLASPRP